MTYNIKEVHYRDVYGNLIWKDEIVFRRLWGVGNELIHDSKKYIVRRVAVADSVQHVNIEPETCKHLHTDFDYICMRCHELVGAR